MFFLLPWRVDVPQERWPVMNWLILVALIGVFALQVRDNYIEQTTRQHSPAPRVQPESVPPAPTEPAAEPHPPELPQIPGITGKLILRGWSLKGLLGHMWLHSGLLHLFGNVLFLWIFGNAVCAKLGNLRYLLLYLLLGVLGGIAHLLVSHGMMLGASGAINGIVGIYAVLFFENEITCLFFYWILLPHVHWFTVSSIWMILFWLLWNVAGVLFPGASHVAYVTHLASFAGGFGIAVLMCKKGWITMERYERSLVQMWEERKRGQEKEPLAMAYAKLGLSVTEDNHDQETSTQQEPPELKLIPLPPLEPSSGHVPRGTGRFIRTACACGYVIKTTRQYAGKTVRCPNCRQPVVIPDRTDFFGPAPQPTLGTAVLQRSGDDHIRFVCACGKRIKVPARYAGRTAKCPHCGTRLRIPAAPSP